MERVDRWREERVLEKFWDAVGRIREESDDGTLSESA